MFSIFKQTYPATGVEHSVYCRFYNNYEKNLVVSGANILKIFRLIPGNEDSNKKEAVKMKLECLASYNLFGTVMSLASASLPGSSRDILLLSFANAKLSLIEYDPISDNIKTLSLHNFEGQLILCP